MTRPLPWSALLFVPWTELLAAGEASAQRAFEAREETARSIRLYTDRLIPGLLQVPGYARTVLAEAIRRYPVPGNDLEEAVTARTARQAVLTDPDTTVHAVVHEDALYQPVGQAGVMAVQMRHLTGLAAVPPVALRLGVLPRATGYHPALAGGGFIVYDEAVEQETTGGLLTLSDPAVVADCRQQHDVLAERAVYGSAAVELIGRARLHWEQAT
ncbi:DUF5753 domain-containing protein [Actinocorallia libanotica]|uniref:DUF5753 domain-containing protein n=1 Tax=Actinocorallia libanotica TaxID=46162 RepID=A0ABN1REQ6_9ACTN